MAANSVIQTGLLAPSWACLCQKRQYHTYEAFNLCLKYLRRPDVVIELPKRLTIPMKAIEIYVAPALSDTAKEVLKPANSLRRVRDARTAAPDSGLTKRFYVADPFIGRGFGRNVGLVRQFRLVESENHAGIGPFHLLVKLVDVGVVPLHRYELEGV